MDNQNLNDEDFMLNNNDDAESSSKYTRTGKMFIVLMFVLGGVAGHYFAKLIKYSENDIPLFTNLYNTVGSSVFFTASYFIGMILFLTIAVLMSNKLFVKKI